MLGSTVEHAEERDGVAVQRRLPVGCFELSLF